MKISVCKTEGIIIRRFNSGEFDKLLVIYTKEFGKILIKAKSLRKKTAKLRGSLELFNYVHLMLAKGKNIDTVAGATIMNCFPNVRGRFPPTAALYYISELLDKMVVAPEKDAKIWNMVVKSFSFLEEKQGNESIIKKLINRFEHNLVSYLGYLPALANEALQADRPEKVHRGYIDFIQELAGEKIESFAFLQLVL